MRKWLLTASPVILAAFSFSSCRVHRDCQGVKHTTLSNGVRI